MRPRILLLILLIISIAFPAMAQTMVIDIDQAMELALENNKQLKMLKVDNDYANLQVKEAYSGAMPVVSAVGNYSRNFIIPEMVTDFVMTDSAGSSIPMSLRMAMGRENNFYGGITLHQPLWIAGKIGIAIKIAKIYRQISETGVEKGEKDLRLQVTQAFYGALLGKEYKRLTKDAEKQIESHLKDARAIYAEGLVSEYDLLRAEVELANFHPQVTAAVEAHKMALEGLRIVLGLAPDTEFEPAGELSEITPNDIELEEAVSAAKDSRADFRQLSLQKQMLDQLLMIEQRNLYWPSFFLSLSYTQQAQEDNFAFDDYFWGDGLAAAVSVSVPLFDGFKTKSRIQMAQINLKKSLLMNSQLEDGVRFEIISSMSRLNEARDKLSASRKAVQQAGKGYAIAEVRYQEGISTQVELLDARLAQTQAQTTELAARYDLILANASLRNAMGQ
ncbi:MAG: TolC family protein [FCB group bacterium]|nr:TolC family protein [FCB group bacterium]